MSEIVLVWLLFYNQSGADKNIKYICQFKIFNIMKINNPFPQHDRDEFTAAVIIDLLCPVVTSLCI